MVSLALMSVVSGASASRTAQSTTASLTATAGSTAAAASPVQVDPDDDTVPQAGGDAVDTAPHSGADAVTIVRFLDSGKYQLQIINTSSIGYINTFNWVAPPGMTVTAVTSSEGARCSLVSGTIYCVGKLAPPKCTCQAGGSMTVNFTATGLTPTFADGHWTYYGVVGSALVIRTVTPVPYHIPSFVPPQNVDLPLCKKGHVSTKAKPCASG